MTELADVAGEYQGQFYPAEGDPSMWTFAVDLEGRIITEGDPDLNGEVLQHKIEREYEFRAGEFLLTPRSRYRSSSKVRALTGYSASGGRVSVDRSTRPELVSVSDLALGGYYGIASHGGEGPPAAANALRFRLVEPVTLGAAHPNALVDIDGAQYYARLEAYFGGGTWHNSYRMWLYNPPSSWRTGQEFIGRPTVVSGVHTAQLWLMSTASMVRTTSISLWSERFEWIAPEPVGSAVEA